MTSKAVVKVATSIVLAASLYAAPAARAQLIADAEAQLRVQWLQMKREMPRHPNPAVQRFAECIAWAIIDVIPAEYQDLNWEIIVFDNSATNASVTPDGKIAVFSGLLRVADTPNELAAVIGHEIAHLTEGHVGERVGRMATTGLLGIVGGAATGFRREAHTVAQTGFLLPFQRGQESEADLVGMEYMAKAGYDPSAVLDLWQEMGKGRRDSGWLSTHPNPTDRLRDMALNLSPVLKMYNDGLDAGVRPRCSL